ncbi:MAG: hypothetical protein ACO1SX_29175 [Actinomycetota bacterium]
MRRTNALALAMTLSLAVSADAKAETPRLEKGTAVTLVGRISSAPKAILGERKMQVAIGPDGTDYTLHFDGATLLGVNGRQMDESELVNRQWVRAEGQVMKSPRRIRVARLQVVAADSAAFKQSAFHRAGLEHGYLTSVAGTRQTFPMPPEGVRAAPMLILGRVSGIAGDFETTRVIQVTAAGNEWALTVPKAAQIVDPQGALGSIRSLGERQWVRVHGWRTEDLRMRVARIESLGKDDAFRASASYRADRPLGYAETPPPTALERHQLTGTITAVNGRERLLVKVRGAKEPESEIWLPAAEVTVRNRSAQTNELRVGDEVAITTFTFR